MKEERKILITAPLPPPVYGMSLATSMFIDGVKKRDGYSAYVIDTAMDKGVLAHNQSTTFAPEHITKIIKHTVRDSLDMLLTNYDIHYLCIGVDYKGIIRYLPYILMSRFKRRPYVVHIHNGVIGDMYKALPSFKQRVIRNMLGGSSAVIVLGDRFRGMLKGIVDADKVKAVPNCVSNNYIATADHIMDKKIRVSDKIKVLYLNNIMEDKGIFELIDAVLLIPNAELHIAGAIERREGSEKRLKMLLEKYSDKLSYYGVVGGTEKRRLFSECDIFSLPTRSDGQPIAILEAYANGLAVVTDESRGVGGIFTDCVNGYTCKPTSPTSIRDAILKCHAERERFVVENFKYAITNFTEERFTDDILNIIDNQL